MLPKKNRANKKTIEKIFKKSIFIGSHSLNLKYFFNKDNTSPRVSFIVPKTVEKKATERNFLRRKGYLILEKYWNKIPNDFVGVFIFNKQKEKNLPEVIEEDIKIILNKI